MAKKKFPARIHALLAREEPVGVIFRRGPSKQVCTLLWDRAKDTFSVGQWLRGRIYERRADLSPDGKLMIYLAMNGRWQSEVGGAWTAISRAPWLKALVLWGTNNCWNGGGLFLTNQRYWLNESFGYNLLQDSPEVQRDSHFTPQGHYGGECPGVYYHRLQRDKWEMKGYLSAVMGDAVAIFEKRASEGWILRKFAHEQTGAPPGKGCYWDEHELEQPQTGQIKSFPDWEWAEVDGETLVWAEKGCLYRATLTQDGLMPKLLYDFNEMSFEERQAPY